MRRILRFVQTNRHIFNAIKDRKKTIETRAATVKYKNLKKGDVLELVCGSERFSRKIKRVRHFKTIVAMLKICSIQKINPFIVTKKELEERYRSFPGYAEKIKKFGLMTFEI